MHGPDGGRVGVGVGVLHRRGDRRSRSQRRPRLPETAKGKARKATRRF
jgi:hypothetical protein